MTLICLGSFVSGSGLGVLAFGRLKIVCFYEGVSICLRLSMIPLMGIS